MNLSLVNEVGLAAFETSSLFVSELYLPDKGSASFLHFIPSTVSGSTQLWEEVQRLHVLNPKKDPLMCVAKTYKQAACVAGVMELSCQDSFQTFLTTAYSEKPILHHDAVGDFREKGRETDRQKHQR